MERIIKLFGVTICVFFILILVNPLYAATGLDPMAPDKEEPIAVMRLNPDNVEWWPHVEYAALSLTVKGEGGSYFGQEFGPDNIPVFMLLDDNGNRFPDGSCTYELRAIPLNISNSRYDNAASIRNTNRPDFKGSIDVNNVSEKSLVQSGYFFILGGKIVTETKVEREDLKDIVHADDVIIDGSLCVGNDCYSGLAFGFDTIVMMENNLRIFFDDTSTIQNYPRNDWRVIANDSTDGGGNYFAIEDATDVSNVFVLEAGAPSNSLYVDSHGDVGINTSTPYYELHIVDGDSPCIRLDQDGSYGWTPQKWDLCGNESNFFIRDATHTSKLPFRIEPDAPTNSIFIKSNGNVGIGAGVPSQKLEVEGGNVLVQNTSAGAGVIAERTDGKATALQAGLSGSSFLYENTGGFYILAETRANVLAATGSGSNSKLMINSSGNVGIGTTSPGYKLHVAGVVRADSGFSDGSSRSLKTNIKTLAVEEALYAFNELNPVKYNYKTDLKEDRVGFIAEDVPDLVASNDRKGISSMDIVAILTKVVQEQQKTISELSKKSAEDQKLIYKLRLKMDEFEQQMSENRNRTLLSIDLLSEAMQ